MGDIKDETAIPGLISILNDKNADVRFAAVYSLVQIIDKITKAIPVLKKVLENEEDEEIRDFIEDLLNEK